MHCTCECIRDSIACRVKKSAIDLEETGYQINDKQGGRICNADKTTSNEKEFTVHNE